MLNFTINATTYMRGGDVKKIMLQGFASLCMTWCGYEMFMLHFMKCSCYISNKTFQKHSLQGICWHQCSWHSAGKINGTRLTKMLHFQQRCCPFQWLFFFFCFGFNMFEKIVSIYDDLNARNEFCDLWFQWLHISPDVFWTFGVEMMHFFWHWIAYCTFAGMDKYKCGERSAELRFFQKTHKKNCSEQKMLHAPALGWALSAGGIASLNGIFFICIGIMCD